MNNINYIRIILDVRKFGESMATHFGHHRGSKSIHSHAAKIEVITQKILEMNSRGDTVG